MNGNMSRKAGSAFGGKKVVLFLVVLGLAGGWYYFYGHTVKEVKAPEIENKQETKKAENLQVQNSASKNSTVQTKSEEKKATSTPKGVFSDGSEMEGPDISVVEIVYDGFEYKPNSVNIKVGDYVVFKNKSNDKFWPASNPHPIHDDYSAFDPKKPVDAGGKWQFQFTEAGNWKFHDHLNPSARGVVNVTAK